MSLIYFASLSMLKLLAMSYSIGLRNLTAVLKPLLVLSIVLINFSFAENFNNGRNRNAGVINNEAIFLQDSSQKPATSVDAQYPGGAAAWSKYLMMNIKYPSEAFKNKIQGTIMLEFTIDEKGRVRNIKATGPAEGGLKEEAIRLLRESGRWIPAKINDKPVSSTKTQPIIFKFA